MRLVCDGDDENKYVMYSSNMWDDDLYCRGLQLATLYLVLLMGKFHVFLVLLEPSPQLFLVLILV